MPPELTYDQGQDVDFMMDITNPISPVVVASFVTATPAQKLAVHGQHLYVLDGASELYAGEAGLRSPAAGKTVPRPAP